MKALYFFLHPIKARNSYELLVSKEETFATELEALNKVKNFLEQDNKQLFQEIEMLRELNVTYFDKVQEATTLVRGLKNELNKTLDSFPQQEPKIPVEQTWRFSESEQSKRLNNAVERLAV